MKLPRCQCGGRLKSYGQARPNPRWKCLLCGHVHSAKEMTVLLILQESALDTRYSVRVEPCVDSDDYVWSVLVDGEVLSDGYEPSRRAAFTAARRAHRDHITQEPRP